VVVNVVMGINLMNGDKDLKSRLINFINDMRFGMSWFHIQALKTGEAMCL
jgi:hypothetical protein